MPSEAVAEIAAVAYDPFGQAGRLVEDRNGVRQFVGQPGRDEEADGAVSSVFDHAGFDAIAATRAAKCFTIVSLGRRFVPFFRLGARGKVESGPPQLSKPS